MVVKLNLANSNGNLRVSTTIKYLIYYFIYYVGIYSYLKKKPSLFKI